VPTVALPDGTLIPVFQIVGNQWRGISTDVPRDAVNPVPPDWLAAWEVFVMDRTNVLQLTDFRRVDTAAFPPFYSSRDERVYFMASADPLGSNPSHDCQMFSMEPVTRAVRQVTFFHEGGDHTAACIGGQRPNGCTCNFALGADSPQNPATGSIYFMSQCDPLGLNPNGHQVFAIQPDGTGVQQVTNARGLVRSADGTVQFEVVEGFWAYAPPR